MRILHVIPSMATSYGGPSYALAQMQGMLQKLDVSSTIAAVHASKDGDLNIPYYFAWKPMTSALPTCLTTRRATK